MKKINIKILLFFLGYSLVLFSDMFSAVKAVSNIVNYIDYVGLGILLYLIILSLKEQKVTYYKFFTIILVIALLFIVKIYSGDNLLLKLFLITLAFKNIKIDKFFKYDMWIRIIYMIIVITLYKIGLTSTYIMYREDGSIRSSMGFSHPNNFGQYILVICCDYIFIHFKNLKFYNYLIPIISIYLIDKFSNSRTSELCLLVLLVLTIIYNIKPKFYKNKYIKRIVINIFLIFTVFTLLMVHAFNNNNKTMIEINQLLSNRLYYASKFLEKYDITLFGNEITMLYTQEARSLGQQPWLLDNSYLVCILRYGIFAYLVIYFFIRKSLKQLLENEHIDLIIMWIVISLNGVFENYLFKIHFNPFLIILSYLLYNGMQKYVKNKEDKLQDEYFK